MTSTWILLKIQIDRKKAEIKICFVRVVKYDVIKHFSAFSGILCFFTFVTFVTYDVISPYIATKF